VVALASPKTGSDLPYGLPQPIAYACPCPYPPPLACNKKKRNFDFFIYLFIDMKKHFVEDESFLLKYNEFQSNCTCHELVCA